MYGGNQDSKKELPNSPMQNACAILARVRASESKSNFCETEKVDALDLPQRLFFLGALVLTSRVAPGQPISLTGGSLRVFSDWGRWSQAAPASSLAIG